MMRISFELPRYTLPPLSCDFVFLISKRTLNEYGTALSDTVLYSKTQSPYAGASQYISRPLCSQNIEHTVPKRQLLDSVLSESR
jgi:hypothetical protein